MKQFLIKYRHTNGTTEDWHKEIAKYEIKSVLDDLFPPKK